MLPGEAQPQTVNRPAKSNLIVQADQPTVTGSVESVPADLRHVTITRHKSRTLELGVPFSTAVVGAPEIADVLPMSDTVVYIQGKKIGTTNISVFDTEKHLIAVIDVEVTIDAAHITRSIQSSIDSTGIRVTGAGDQVVLSGVAKDAVDAERAVSIAQAMAPGTTVINAMRISQPQQVMLKVRYLEVNRNAAREIGVNWYASNPAGTRGINTGLGGPTAVGKVPAIGDLPIFEAARTFASGTTAAPFAVAVTNVLSKDMNLDAMITALEQRGLVRLLAEPNLVALSGDKASFLAGGEIPVPTVQPSGGAPLIAIEYKRFGVELAFEPTVVAGGVINLHIQPSVSQLDYTNAVEVQGFRIPALSKRETKTTIELRGGQSFAISGLLQSEGLRDIQQVPWLGTVPVLGALFRSTSYQNRETDLVVIVTPHMVEPAAPGQQLASPLDQRIPANDRDLFLNGQLDLPKRIPTTSPPAARSEAPTVTYFRQIRARPLLPSSGVRHGNVDTGSARFRHGAGGEHGGSSRRQRMGRHLGALCAARRQGDHHLRQCRRGQFGHADRHALAAWRTQPPHSRQRRAPGRCDRPVRELLAAERRRSRFPDREEHGRNRR
jgi:pilus assembly protein CpaC